MEECTGGGGEKLRGREARTGALAGGLLEERGRATYRSQQLTPDALIAPLRAPDACSLRSRVLPTVPGLKV